MSSNIEIKACISNLSQFEALVQTVSDGPCYELLQEDTYFNHIRGRLKIRIINSTIGELIFYTREDISGPKESLYHIYKIENIGTLMNQLSATLGVLGIVKKCRKVYMAHQTRIHLDRVDGLGNFVELEVVLSPEQSVENGTDIAHRLINKLGINPGDLIKGSYLDLLLRSHDNRSS